MCLFKVLIYLMCYVCRRGRVSHGAGCLPWWHAVCKSERRLPLPPPEPLFSAVPQTRVSFLHWATVPRHLGGLSWAVSCSCHPRCWVRSRAELPYSGPSLCPLHPGLHARRGWQLCWYVSLLFISWMLCLLCRTKSVGWISMPGNFISSIVFLHAKGFLGHLSTTVLNELIQCSVI